MAIEFSLSEIRFLSIILRLVTRAPDKSMSEAQIIELAERSRWLNLNERENVPSRLDSRFANRVHNIVCHRDSRKNPIRLRLIEWDADHSSFRITEKGMDFLRNVARKLGGQSADDFSGIDHWLSTKGG